MLRCCPQKTRFNSDETFRKSCHTNRSCLKMNEMIRMAFVRQLYCLLCLLSTLSIACGEFCREYGHTCSDFQRCCGKTCCIPTDLENHYHAHIRWSVWNMWYFWFVVLFVLMSCFGGCSYYRRHQLLIARQQSMIGTSDSAGYSGWRFPPAFPISLFAGWDEGPSQRLRSHHATTTTATNPTIQPTLFPTPPPYAEVMSQPDIYPPNNKDLPPYPGNNHTEGNVLPPYAGPMSQLPPYSAVSYTQDTSSCMLLPSDGATTTEPTREHGRLTVNLPPTDTTQMPPGDRSTSQRDNSSTDT